MRARGGVGGGGGGGEFKAGSFLQSSNAIRKRKPVIAFVHRPAGKQYPQIRYVQTSGNKALVYSAPDPL